LKKHKRAGGKIDHKVKEKRGKKLSDGGVNTLGEKSLPGVKTRGESHSGSGK